MEKFVVFEKSVDLMEERMRVLCMKEEKEEKKMEKKEKLKEVEKRRDVEVLEGKNK